MSRRAVIFILWLLLPFCCFAQVDSTRLAELDKRLDKYFKSLSQRMLMSSPVNATF